MESTQQQAEIIFENIRQQAAYLANQIPIAAAILLKGSIKNDQIRRNTNADGVRLKDIERFSENWSPLVLDSPEIKAHIFHKILQQYSFEKARYPNTSNILGLNNEDVQQAYLEIYKTSIAESLSNVRFEREERSALSMVLSGTGVEMLQDAIKYQYLDSGEVLFNMGDPADKMYVITSGRLDVLIHNDGETTKVAEHGRFQILGDMALVLEEKRTATVVAARDTELWSISKEDFNDLIDLSPQLTMQMLRLVTKRLADLTHNNIKIDQVSTIAVIPAGHDSNIKQFTQYLVHGLSNLNRCLHLDSDNVSQEVNADLSLQRDDLTYMRLTAWLNTQELQYKFVVYEADQSLNEWTKTCIHQADRILLVGKAHASPELNEIEVALFEGEKFSERIEKIMVFSHEDRKRLMTNTRDWLAKRPVSNHYRVVQNDGETTRSLLRHLIGRPLALVLSGGSARGFFHIGVLRALEEAGQHVDYIGGTSAGSIVGSLWGIGKSSDEIEKILREAFTTGIFKVADLTIPWTSVIGGKKINQILKGFYGDLDIEDLWMPFYCTSVDLTASEQVVHTKGKLWQVIRSSIAVWPMLPPYMTEDSHMHVDGATFNNLPIAEMRELSPSCYLVASDVGAVYYVDDSQYDWGEDVSFWKTANSLLNPFSKMKLPNGFGLGLRQIEANGKYKAMSMLPYVDVHIKPILENISAFDLKKVDDLIEMGYAHGVEMVKDWNFKSESFATIEPEPLNK